MKRTNKTNQTERFIKEAVIYSLHLYHLSPLKAIGRVIRHRLDYGAILLCDQRFSNANLTRQLSAWVRPRLQTFPKMGPLLRDLGQFFRAAELLFPSGSRPLRGPTSAEPDSVDGRKAIASVDSCHHAFSATRSRTVPQAQPKSAGQLIGHELSRCKSLLRSYIT